MMPLLNEHAEPGYKYLVFFKRDGEPTEIIPFTDKAEADQLYETLATSWCEVYLCRVLAGPGNNPRNNPVEKEED